MKIVNYNYSPESIQSGIVHIGVGNFHRAHQEFYTNLLLEDEDQRKWGICGVCLLPSDEKIVKALREQNLDYTLTVCGRNGQDELYKIGSMSELIWGVEQPADVINKLADASIKIITLTITEGGYNINKSTNKFNLEDEKIKKDLNNQGNPLTIFGFIAKGLQKRMKLDNGGVTILTCDNLQHNGNTAKKAFLTFIEAMDAELAAWVKDNVSFPNSMVDRITPATTEADVVRLNEKSGIKDSAPVYCEDFCQWVIEDNFIAGRPAWERVGVEFTDDVAAYENMKLSLLNASHTLLSYPSFLMGYRKVDAALCDKRIAKFIRDFMDIDITPYVPAPANTDLELYKKTLLERFANHSVSDQLSRLCFDGISKFPVYVVPNMTKMIKDKKDLTRIAFLLASYRHYLKYKVDDLGVVYEVAEPWITAQDSALILNDDSTAFLELSPFSGANLKGVEPLVSLYKEFATRIKSEGTASVLEYIIK